MWGFFHAKLKLLSGRKIIELENTHAYMRIIIKIKKGKSKPKLLELGI